MTENIHNREEDLDDFEGRDLAGFHLQWGYELALPRLRTPSPDAGEEVLEVWGYANLDHGSLTILYSLDEKVLRNIRTVAQRELDQMRRKMVESIRRAFLLVFPDGRRAINMAGIDARQITQGMKSLPRISRLLTMDVYERVIKSDPQAFVTAFMTPFVPKVYPAPTRTAESHVQIKRHEAPPFGNTSKLRVSVDRAVSSSPHYPHISVEKGQEFIASYVVRERGSWVCYIRVPGQGELIPFPCDAFSISEALA